VIARAPRHATAILGTVRLVAGPARGVVRWTGWAEVWMHPDGKQRAAFPKMTSIREVRAPDRFLWVGIVKSSFQEAS
jgi:hypothetical protein